jgi:hypothetical protein
MNGRSSTSGDMPLAELQRANSLARNVPHCALPHAQNAYPVDTLRGRRQAKRHKR